MKYLILLLISLVFIGNAWGEDFNLKDYIIKHPISNRQLLSDFIADGNEPTECLLKCVFGGYINWSCVYAMCGPKEPECHWEFREIKIITDKTTWTISDGVTYPGTWPLNRIEEFSYKEVLEESKLFLKEYMEWDILKIDPFYTKNTPKNEKHYAGQFWLGLEIWLKRKVCE